MFVILRKIFLNFLTFRSNLFLLNNSTILIQIFIRICLNYGAIYTSDRILYHLNAAKLCIFLLKIRNHKYFQQRNKKYYLGTIY